MKPATYGRGTKPAQGLAFDPNSLPKTTPLPKQTIEQLQRLEAGLRERDEKLSALLTDKAAFDAELTRLRAEVAQAKQANTAQADTHDYSEAETRDYFIDLLLKEAGWALDQERDREFPVDGMPNTQGKGFVDYVLWGDNGLPLALVEAKRTKRDPRVGQRQAELYADCLEKQFGRRPVVFYSNGYEHWLWDDLNYPPRPVQGFLKKAELELLIQRRSWRKKLAEAKINEAIVERYYQTRAIRRIGEAFEKDGDRKTLVVMATGAGKTRTVIALCDLLMRCNWAKRVLFLADRVALVNQAVNAFKKHLPESSPVNLVTEKESEGRVFVSTYPTMMGLIDETNDGARRFGVGHFDLVIIDEAHRSVYQKYRAIFEYFDSLLVGLTATPRDEIDRDTYGLFDLEKGVPTDAYDLKDAVADKFLVPSQSVSVPLKFQREGIRYDDLSPEEQEQWDAQEWNDDGVAPDYVEAEAVNKWLFNIDTVDKVLEHIMTRGQKVAGGVFGTSTGMVPLGSHSWAVDVDGVGWEGGLVTITVGGQSVEVNQGAVYSWPAGSPSPTPSPSPTASPTPSASPTPTATPQPTATPGASPTGSPSEGPDGGSGATPTPWGGGDGGGASPTPAGGGDGGGASPTPSGTPSESGSGSGDNTEQEMEAAIQATFGNTAGAPVANSNDFQPQGSYSPPPDEVSAGLDSARGNIDGDTSIFQGLMPDLSGFQSIGTQYTFTLDFTALGLGNQTIDLTPYSGGISLLRGLTLGMVGLVLVIKFIKHLGPTL
jgi:hypothetical protein